MAPALANEQTSLLPRQRLSAQFNPRQKYREVVVHKSVSSIANNNAMEEKPMSALPSVGTFRKPKRQPINKSTVTQELSATLRDAYGPYASKHKKVAEHAGIKSARTAEAWSCGRNLPALEYFLELGRNSPAIQKMTMRLWGLDADIDPEYSRVLNDLRQLVRAEGR